MSRATDILQLVEAQKLLFRMTPQQRQRYVKQQVRDIKRSRDTYASKKARIDQIQHDVLT